MFFIVLFSTYIAVSQVTLYSSILETKLQCDVEVNHYQHFHLAKCNYLNLSKHHELPNCLSFTRYLYRTNVLHCTSVNQPFQAFIPKNNTKLNLSNDQQHSFLLRKYFTSDHKGKTLL